MIRLIDRAIPSVRALRLACASLLLAGCAFAEGTPAAPTGGLINPFIPLPWSPTGIQYAGQFGFSAAPAGDVNGDGYSDVIVGALAEDNTEIDEGRAHLFLGSPGGLLANPTRIYVTGQDSSYAGWSVAPAGDVNGDGYADFVVGVPYWDTPTDVNAGKVMVFYGGTNLPFLPSVELFSPVPAPFQNFGRTIAPAGDVNGDGYDDLLVGTPYYSEGGFGQRGAVFVFHGSPGGLATTPARTWTGPAENGYFGDDISTAGDVNGDGFADVIVGAPLASTPLSNCGAAHVFLGSASGAEALADTVITGAMASEICGIAVANAGDMNGDGYADVVIGSSGYDAGVGRCRVVFGGPFGLATGTFLVNSESAPLEFFGNIVATLGDIDADGFADIGVSSRYVSGGGRGRIAVYKGGRTAISFVGDLLTPGGTTGYFGNSIATAGDTDGDGFSEILIGTEDWSIAPAFYEGRVFLYAAPLAVPALSGTWPRSGAQPGTGYGTAVTLLPQPGGATYPQLFIGDPGFDGWGRISFHNGGIFSGIGVGEGGAAFVGSVNFQSRGARLADVGDVNRDGYGDLVASSTTLDNGSVSQAGRVDFHPGSIGGILAPVTLLAGDRDFDRVGTALANRGDVNGDGYHDILVGAREWDSASLEDCGKAWLFLGSPTGPAPAPWTREGSAAHERLGASVALTDLDGDGYSDVVIGVSAAPDGIAPPPGRVEVFYGGPGGPDATPGLVLTDLEPNITFGSVVAAIGDVNGDAIADLAVGAYEQGGTGRVYLYEGTRGRSQGRIPMRVYHGLQAGARFGAAIAGGGDVDGDGFGDFAIGSPSYDSGVQDDGRIDVYRGAQDEPSTSPFFSYSNGITGSRVGESIAPLADGNLDGLADIVVGAPGSAGRVYPFLGGGDPGHVLYFKLYEINVGNKRRLHPTRIDDPAMVSTIVAYASPAGRIRSGVQFELALQKDPFTGTPTQSTGIIYDSGAPNSNAGLLSSVTRVFPAANLPWPGHGYHLRARFVTRSPYFPRSRWITPEAHTSGDLDVWAAGPVVDAGPVPEADRGPGLHGVAPNPAGAASASRVTFALAEPGRARLEFYDVRGALVRRLLDEDRPAGATSIAWDGRDDHGRAVPAGLYFAVFSAEGRTDRARVVRLP